MGRGAISALLLVVWASPALAQQYVVTVDESGDSPTSYEKRNNWRYYGDYRHTTMVADPNDPLACQESPCLDDGEPGDKGPDATRGGTASATLPGMTPGKYRLELRYNQTQNRSTSVPWKITSDAAGNNMLSGKLDQKNTATGPDKWLVLGQSDQSPIEVQSSVTFVFGSATAKFDGSLSYGGIRLVKTGELDPPAADSGTPDAAEPDAGLPDSGAPPDAGTEPDAAVAPELANEEADAGCGCVVGAPARRELPWLGLLIVGWAFRRLSRAARATPPARGK